MVGLSRKNPRGHEAREHPRERRDHDVHDQLPTGDRELGDALAGE